MSTETLRANFKTQLKTITTDNGYTNDIGDVLNDVVLQDGTTYPAAFITLPEADLSALAGHHEKAREKIFIFFIVKNETAPMAALLSLRDDILKCIAANPTLSGAVDRIERGKYRIATEIYQTPPSGYPPGFNPPFAAGVIECAADWRYSQLTGVKI